MRIRLTIRGFFFAAVGLSLWAISALAATPTDPSELVERLSGEFSELIQINRALYKDQPQLLIDEVDQRMRQHIDTRYAARLVLGRHGRGREDAEINRFAEALASSLLNQYATRLLDFDHQNNVEVLDLEPGQDPRRTRVRTRLQLDTGSLMPIDFILRWQNEQWLIFDVIVEGISYVATYRTQIGEQITRLGFNEMVTRLEQGQVQFESDV